MSLPLFVLAPKPVLLRLISLNTQFACTIIYPYYKYPYYKNEKRKKRTPLKAIFFSYRENIKKIEIYFFIIKS